MFSRLLPENRMAFRPGRIKREIRDVRAIGEGPLWRPLLKLPGEFVAVYLCRRTTRDKNHVRRLNYVIRSLFLRRGRTLQTMHRLSGEIPMILQRLENEGRAAGHQGRLYYFRFFIPAPERPGRGKMERRPISYLCIARTAWNEQAPQLKTLEEFSRLLSWKNGSRITFANPQDGASRSLPVKGVNGNSSPASSDRPRTMNSEIFRYLASIAHDIRMPLSGALLIVDRMERTILSSSSLTADDSRLQPDIHRLRQYLISAGNLAADILHMELAGSRVDDKREKFRGGDLISAILHSQRQLLESKRTRLQLIESEEDHLLIDRTALERILYNLISNGARFCAIPGRIRIETEKKAGYWIVEIEDNGPGMTASDLELAGRNVGRGGSGWGIGLYSAMKQCERLGGFFSVLTPKFLSGCRFLLVLPDGLNQICPDPGEHSI